MSTTEKMDRYQVVGPRGEGPFVVEAISGLDAAAKVNATFPMRTRSSRKHPGHYSLEQPRGKSGPVVGYEPVQGNGGVVGKVGAFDIIWLPEAAWEDYPLTSSAK